MTRRTENKLEYQSWKGMRERVRNPNCNCYHRYGGRGIKICDRWINSFDNFLDDMGTRPSKGHCIDRIDNDGDYTKENCRWVEHKENGRNTKSSKRWFIDGVKYDSLVDASEKLNKPVSTLKAMCDGVTSNGYRYPPKDNCWSEKVY